jgi:tetratricopeptide (TPR) repeat protein
VATFGWREEEDARVTDPQVLRSQADEILELHERGELEAALRACDALLAADAATGVHDEVVRESVFAARFERGVLLTELGELDAAAEAYAEAAATPSDLDDPDQRHELAMALLNRGICLDALDRSEEALRVYDQLIAELGDADDPVTVDQVVRARVNRGAVLLTLERTQEALSVAESSSTAQARRWRSSRRHSAASRATATMRSPSRGLPCDWPRRTCSRGSAMPSALAGCARGTSPNVRVCADRASSAPKTAEWSPVSPRR